MSFKFRFFSFVFSLALVPGSSNAHELMVFASRHSLPESGGESTIYLCNGHRFPVDELLEAEAIERYDMVSPAEATSTLQRKGLSIHANVVDFKQAGVYTVVASRKPSIWTYLTDAQGERHITRGSKIDHEGKKMDTSTRYSMFAKTLVVVGKPCEAAPKPVGMTVEIIPLDGPAKWLANKDIRFQVLENGKPVPSVDVVARNVGFKPDNAWNYATETSEKGEFSIRPNCPGTWIVGIEFKKPSPDEARREYDFASFATTLTFEVLP